MVRSVPSPVSLGVGIDFRVVCLRNEVDGKETAGTMTRVGRDLIVPALFLSPLINFFVVAREKDFWDTPTP